MDKRIVLTLFLLTLLISDNSEQAAVNKVTANEKQRKKLSYGSFDGGFNAKTMCPRFGNDKTVCFGDFVYDKNKLKCVLLKDKFREVVKEGNLVFRKELMTVKAKKCLGSDCKIKVIGYLNEDDDILYVKTRVFKSNVSFYSYESFVSPSNDNQIQRNEVVKTKQNSDDTFRVVNTFDLSKGMKAPAKKEEKKTIEKKEKELNRTKPVMSFDTFQNVTFYDVVKLNFEYIKSLVYNGFFFTIGVFGSLYEIVLPHTNWIWWGLSRIWWSSTKLLSWSWVAIKYGFKLVEIVVVQLIKLAILASKSSEGPLKSTWDYVVVYAKWAYIILWEYLLSLYEQAMQQN
nr:hypothetical protein [Carrot associated RNA virus 1]